MKILTQFAALTVMLAFGVKSHAGLIEITQTGKMSGIASVDCSVQGNGPVLNSRQLTIQSPTGYDQLAVHGFERNQECEAHATASAFIGQTGDQLIDDFSLLLNMNVEGNGGESFEGTSANVFMAPLLFEVSELQDIRLILKATLGFDVGNEGTGSARAHFALKSIDNSFLNFYFEDEARIDMDMAWYFDELLSLEPGSYELTASLSGLAFGVSNIGGQSIGTNSSFRGSMTAQVFEVPTATSLALLCIGLVGLVVSRRKRLHHNLEAS